MGVRISDAAILILLSKDDAVLKGIADKVGLNTRDEYNRNLLDHIVLQATDSVAPEADNPLHEIQLCPRHSDTSSRSSGNIDSV